MKYCLLYPARAVPESGALRPVWRAAEDCPAGISPHELSPVRRRGKEIKVGLYVLLG